MTEEAKAGGEGGSQQSPAVAADKTLCCKTDIEVPLNSLDCKACGRFVAPESWSCRSLPSETIDAFWQQARVNTAELGLLGFVLCQECVVVIKAIKGKGSE